MNRSLLAGVNALYRMAETRRPAGDRVLEDRWAEMMVERSVRVRLIRYGRFVVPGLWRLIDELQTTHCVRHRTIDELILSAVEKKGATQVVVLGAGYDMRPYRFAERLRGVRWIEVDHPATQARKIELLARFSSQAVWPSDSIAPERVAGDLAHTRLETVLERTGFDAGRPTCFVAEGVIHYLPLAAIKGLFRSVVHSGKQNSLVFSFIEASVYAEASPTLVALVRAVREKPLVSFGTREAEAMCLAAGFASLRTWSLAQQIAAFAPEAVRRNQGPSQHVALASGGLA